LALSYVAGDVAGPTRGEPPRVAYAVSKRVGPAVVRNRVRRRLRHAVAAHRELLVPDGAYLVIPRPGSADASYAELSRWVAELLAGVPGAPGRPVVRGALG
jgi:ribonuclease P protein component